SPLPARRAGESRERALAAGGWSAATSCTGGGAALVYGRLYSPAPPIMPLKTRAGDHGAPWKGRGATINPEGRFETRTHEAFDDGWFQEPPEGRLETVVTEMRVKSIIARNDSPDVPFSR